MGTVLAGAALLLTSGDPLEFAEAQTDLDGSVTFSAAQPQQGVALTATLSDADGSITSQVWQWASSDTASGTFTDISRATSASYTPAASDVGKYLRASVSYTDALGSGKSASEVTANAVGVVPVTVSFSADKTEIAESGSSTTVTVTVTLSADPRRALSLPISVTPEGTATSADWSGLVGPLSYNVGLTAKTFAITAVNDTLEGEAGEGVTFGLGEPLPAGVTADGANGSLTISIIDDDPVVSVSLDQSSHSVVEGDSVTLTVELNTDPKRELEIPISAVALGTTTAPGGMDPADYAAPPDSVTFLSGQTSRTITLSINQDTTADHGERVRVEIGSSLPPGVERGTTRSATITITDDDPAVAVQFEETEYEVEEGSSVTVTVTLDQDPKRPLVIPIMATETGGATAPGMETADYAAPVANVTFSSGQTSRTFSLSVAEDTVPDDGEGVTFSFGASLPPGVSPGTDSSAAVAIIDDDPAVTVSFGAATYSVEESGTLSVELSLSEDPQRTVVIPITATNLGTATDADYSVSSEVTFSSGDMTQTITFAPINDSLDDDDESVRLSFGSYPPGVGAGATTSTTVSIDDDDDPEVTVQFAAAAYAVAERGEGSVTVTLRLSADPEREVVIPLSSSYGGGATSSDFRTPPPASVTFNSGETSKTFSVQAADDEIDNDDKSVTVSFGSLPSRVTEGATAETVVSVTDDDVRGVTITPSALTIAESTSDTIQTGAYTVKLNSEPTASVTVTISGGAADLSTDSSSLTFTSADWDEPQTVTVTTTEDQIDEGTSERHTLTHGASGGDYSATDLTVADFVLTINDDDSTPVITGPTTKNFPEIEYDADPMTIDLDVATYSATDADEDDTITWSLTGADASKFELTAQTNGDRVLSFKGDEFGDNNGPDFENPLAAGNTNAYKLTVEASDGTNTGKRDVAVSVTAVNERPVIELFINPDATRTVVERPHTVNDPPNSFFLEAFRASDPEGSNVTWSLMGTDRGAYSLVSLDIVPGYSDVISWGVSPNFEDPHDVDENNVYEFTLRAYDGERTTDLEFTVTVSDDPEPPDITEIPGDALTVMEGEYDYPDTSPSIILHTFTVKDPENTPFLFDLVVGPDSRPFSIEPHASDSSKYSLVIDVDEEGQPLLDFEQPIDQGRDNKYRPEVLAFEDEGEGQLASNYFFDVVVTDVNEKPEFTDTPETAINWDENQQASEEIHDYNARDEEGAVDFSLSGDDRGDFNLSTDGKLTFKQQPDFEDGKDADKDSVYEVNIVATDRESGTTRRSASLDVFVTVRDLEEEGDIEVSDLDPGVGGDKVRFTLADPDGDIVVSADDKLMWVVQGSTDGTAWTDLTLDPTIDDPATSVLYFDYTPDEDHVGQQLRATVEYADRRSQVKSVKDKTATSEATNQVTANPKANVSPRWRSSREIIVAEGPVRSTGKLIGEVPRVTDRDGDTVTFGLGPDVDQNVFAIVITTGQLFIIRELDFETAPTLSVDVTVRDGKGVDSANTEIAADDIDLTIPLTITVTDEEEDGVVTLSSERPKTGVDITATLADGDGGVSGEAWQWARSDDGRTDWTNVLGADAATYTPVEDDEGKFLRARVEYTDRRGTGKFAERVTSGTAPSVNRKPTFPTGEDGQRSVAEQSRRGANIGAPVAAADPENDRLSYALSGTDAGAFTIVAGTGQIRVKDELDFETKSSYSLSVNVHDGRDSDGAVSTAIDDTQDVTISVSNVNELGEVALTTETGVVQARVETTAALTDPDGSVGDLTWQWSQSPNGRTNWANVGGATSDTFTPGDTLVGRYIRATATYSDRFNLPGNATQEASAVSARVAGPPPVNSPPVFPASAREREVEENAAGGTDVGAPVAATDLNAGDAAVNAALVYSLSGTDAALFAIDAATGQLSLAATVQAGDLDFETKRTYRVTVSVTDGYDQFGDDEDPDVIDARLNVTINLTDVNEAPEIADDAETAVTVEENVNRAIATFRATDPERDALTWSASLPEFWMSAGGELWFRSPPDYEEWGAAPQTVTITVADPDGLDDMHDIQVTVTDTEEAGVVTITPPRAWADLGTQLTAELADGDGNLASLVWQWARSTNRSGWTDIATATSATYSITSADIGHYLRASVTYVDQRGPGNTASAVTEQQVEETAPSANRAPSFPQSTTTRSIGQGPAFGRRIGALLRATDPDSQDVLRYTLNGVDAGKFEIDHDTGQLLTKEVMDYDPDPQAQNSYTVSIHVSDGFDATYAPDAAPDDTIEVMIAVAPTGGGGLGAVGGGGGGGGGGGAPAVAVPSEADFDWNVRRDIEALDREQEEPTGLWSDGETLYVLNNASGGQDAVFAYDLQTGQRRAQREFALDRRNRFAHGLWSDGETVWVADSGQDRLFAYRLETGERLEAREFALHERNRDPRGIWSDGERLYALDSGKDALFVHDPEDGVLLAEHALDALNGSPRGLWSDGVTLWVSDDGANRVFAYRITDERLERLEAEEFGFRSLLKAGNGEARGIWSDGETLWVADAEDGDVNSYNLPDAVQAYLGSLSLSGLELGEFSPLRYAYEAALPSGVTETTVEAAATQEGATVVVEPTDADPETEGRQVSLAGLSELAVTVTSADGSRRRVYRVALSRAQVNRAPEARDIPALGLTAGGEVGELRLADYFSDPDGDPLSYTVGASSAPGVARVERLDDIVRVTPLRAGMARFRLSATDGELSTETRAVDVTVEAAPLAVELRIAARRLATGAVEFALQVRAEDGGWSERRLPRARFLPAGAQAGRWLVSSALTVGEGEQRASVRIAARRVSGGRVEFALQVQGEDGTWGERRLPRARYLPAGAALDRWLTSSALVLGDVAERN